MLYPATNETNLTATLRSGTTLTASASPHTEAAGWTILVPVTAAASDGFWAYVSGISQTATETGVFLDFAYGDPTTGGNEVEIVPDWCVTAAETSAGASARMQFHPQAIPANKSLSARIRAAIASETCEVAVMLPQTQSNLDSVGAAVTHGAITGTTRLTSVTPGSGSLGSWTEVGTLAADRNLFFPTTDALADTSITNNGIRWLLEIGHGPNSGAVTSIGVFAVHMGTNESIGSPFPPYPVHKAVSAGDKLWARAASGDTEARGVSILASTGTPVASGGGGGGGPRVISPRD